MEDSPYNPYLVTGKIRRTDYMRSPVNIERSHIVMAASEDEAEQKFIAHYTGKSTDYDRYYSVESVVVHDTIW